MFFPYRTIPSPSAGFFANIKNVNVITIIDNILDDDAIGSFD